MRWRTYLGAGGLGALAAVSVVGIVVAAGGIKVKDCTNCLDTALATAAQASTEPAADPSAAPHFELASLDEPVAADAPAAAATTEPVAVAATAADSIPATQASPVVAATTVADTEPQAASPERLSTSLPALDTAAVPKVATRPNGPAVEAARSEAAGKPAADDGSATTLAYADTAVATEVDVTPPGAVKVGPRAINLHASASSASAVVATLLPDTALTAKSRKQGWIEVSDARGHAGWVDRDYLAGGDLAALPKGDDTPEVKTASLDTASDVPNEAVSGPAANTASTDADIRIVGGKGVNVRSGPGSGKGKLFALRGGEQVTVTDEQHGWLHVTDDQGRNGWIYRDYLRSK